MDNYKCTACGMMKLQTNFTNPIVPVCKKCKPEVKKTPKKSKSKQ